MSLAACAWLLILRLGVGGSLFIGHLARAFEHLAFVIEQKPVDQIVAQALGGPAAKLHASG